MFIQQLRQLTLYIDTDEGNAVHVGSGAIAYMEKILSGIDELYGNIVT